MQLPNSLKYMYLDRNFTTITTKSHIFTVLLFLLVIAGSCKKTRPPDYIANVYEKYFETNILNSDFKVKLATDNGVDNTSKYVDYKFRLLKNTFYDGPMTATKISNPSIVYNGTWSSNADFSQLVISITQPTIPTEFNFLNRVWKFTRKAIPVMELAPFGNSEPLVLHMERQ